MGVASLTVFQRTPAWSPPRFDHAYPEALRALFATVPIINSIYRCHSVDLFFEIQYLAQTQYPGTKQHNSHIKSVKGTVS
jgi:hypothetical protein